MHAKLLKLSVVLAGSLLVSYLTWGSFSSSVLAQEEGKQGTAADHFIEQAMQFWKDYSYRAQHLQGTGSYTATSDEMKLHHSYRIKFNDQCYLLQTDEQHTNNGNTSARSTVFAKNSRYAFELYRKSATSSWVIVELIDLRKSALPSRFIQRFNSIKEARHILVSLYQGELLAEVVRKSDFRVLQSRRITKEGHGLVEIRFRYSKDAGNQQHDGTLVLDPGRSWCLRSYDVHIKGPESRARKKWQVVDMGEADGLPVPTRAVLNAELHGSDGTPVSKLIWNFEYDWTNPQQPPPDEEFTLAAFGLPEPPGLEWERPTPWYWWAALLGIACIVGGAFFFWLKQRTAAGRSA